MNIKENIESIQINLLNYCTSKCLTCRKYTWPDDSINYDHLLKTILYLHSQGLKSICFSGGEPLLYKGVSDLMKLCKEKDIKFSFITTGVVNNGVFKEAMYAADRLHISVDSVVPSVYKHIRGVDGFDVVKRNIKSFAESDSGCEVRLSMTVSKLNYKDIFDVYLFAKNNRCKINFYMVHEHDEFMLDDDEKLILKNNIKKVIVDDTNRISNAATVYSSGDLYNNIDVDVDCTIPHVHCLINANGDIYPCCKLLNDNGEYGDQVKYVYGNIVCDDIEKEFNKRFDKVYKSLSYCNGCEERYISQIDNVKNGIVKLFL